LWHPGEHGWPSSTMFSEAPKNEEQQTALIDALQEWKSKKFQEIVGKLMSHCACLLFLLPCQIQSSRVSCIDLF